MKLAALRIAEPCLSDWEAMPGDERTRWCASYELSVTNLSELREAEAELRRCWSDATRACACARYTMPPATWSRGPRRRCASSWRSDRSPRPEAGRRRGEAHPRGGDGLPRRSPRSGAGKARRRGHGPPRDANHPRPGAGSRLTTAGAVVPDTEEIGIPTFDVVLRSHGANKLAVVGLVRKRLGPEVSLADVKKLVESAPVVLLKDARHAEAVEIASELERAGAEVELQ